MRDGGTKREVLMRDGGTKREVLMGRWAVGVLPGVQSAIRRPAALANTGALYAVFCTGTGHGNGTGTGILDEENFVEAKTLARHAYAPFD
eukprot:2275476-Rhodomonas_salina.5